MENDEEKSYISDEEESEESLDSQARRAKKRKIKPVDRRPLSAYNIFFQGKRQEILAAKNNIEGSGPQEANNDVSMVEHIANLWKTIDSAEREHFEQIANEELERYLEEVEANEGNNEILKDEHVEQKTTSRNAGSQQEEPQCNLDAKLETTGTSIPKTEATEDKLDRLLDEEAKALQQARSAKFEQMKLIRQLQALDPHLTDFLDSRRQALGLSPLLPSITPGQHSSNSDRTRPTMHQRSRPRLGMMHSCLQSPNISGRGRDMGLAASDGTSQAFSQPTPPASLLLDGTIREEAMLRMLLQNQGHGGHPHSS